MSQSENEIKMDADDLYRDETITDRRVGTIRVLTPITSDGTEDSSRQTQFIGSAQVMTPAGALPISFDLEASNLKDAVDNFSAASKVALEETANEIRELQRQAASSIVTPGSDPSGMISGLANSGGGKIQMP